MLSRTRNLDMQAFFLSNMIDSFSHAIVLQRPAGLSLATGLENPGLKPVLSE